MKNNNYSKEAWENMNDEEKRALVADILSGVRAKGAAAEKGASKAVVAKREKYEYLEGKGFEGKIYERKEALNFGIKSDIEVAKDEFKRNYVLFGSVYDFQGICKESLMAMFNAGIEFKFAGNQIKIWDVNENADGFKGRSSRNYIDIDIGEFERKEKIMIDGAENVRAFMQKWAKDNKLYVVKIFEIGEYDEENDIVIDGSMFYFKKGKLYALSDKIIAERYDMDNMIEVGIAISSRNENIFIRRSKKISGDKNIEKVKDVEINEEIVMVHNNHEGKIEEVKVNKEERKEIIEYKRSNLDNFIIENLDIMKRKYEDNVSCELKFKDEGRLYINGGDYFSKNVGKFDIVKNGLKADIEYGSKVKVNKSSRFIYGDMKENGLIRIGKFGAKSKAFNYNLIERKNIVVVDLKINHRKRHVKASEKILYNYQMDILNKYSFI